MKKFLLLALSQLFAVSIFADGVTFPRYYELVTQEDQLESGKYYIIVALPDVDDVDINKWNELTGLDNSTPTERIAYNGIDKDNHFGKIGKVFPFSYIIDTQKIWNETNTAVVPLKMTINTTKSTSLGYTVWNFEDFSVGTSNQLIGVNAETTGNSQHYLIGDNNTNENKIDSYHLWKISFDLKRAIIRNVGKTYYLKYDANNDEHNTYGAESSFFRVYASTTAEKRNVLLYKEMETVEAKTSFTGHGTLYYSNKVLMVPEDVTAKTYTLGTHVVSSNTNYATESFIPANSAVVLHGTASTTYTFPVTTRHNPTRDDRNILRGFDTASTTTSGTDDDSKYYFYKLTTKNSTDASSIGFYWAVSGGEPFTSAAHKAYLAVLQTAAARIQSFLLDDSETPTSITQVPTPNTQHPSPDGYIYDLSGRRVSTSQSLPKGIYISNGKKFVVK